MQEHEIDPAELIDEDWFRLLQQDETWDRNGVMPLEAMTAKQCRQARAALLSELPETISDCYENLVSKPVPGGSLECAIRETQVDILQRAMADVEKWADTTPLMVALRRRMDGSPARPRAARDFGQAGQIYTGNPVRAVRFDGDNLDELGALLPGSRNKMVLVHHENERGLQLAASVWTSHCKLTIPFGSWLLTAPDEDPWTLFHSEFRRTYGWH